MENELSLLEADKNDRLKKKYVIKKEKLPSLVLKSYLLPSDFDFDPKRKVEPKDYNTETKAIKAKIKLVKAEALIRKDLVLRMEVIQHCLSQNLDAGKIKELIKVLRCKLEKFIVTQDPFMFEGEELSIYLDNLEADTDEKELQESVDANNRIRASDLTQSRVAHLRSQYNCDLLLKGFCASKGSELDKEENGSIATTLGSYDVSCNSYWFSAKIPS